MSVAEEKAKDSPDPTSERRFTRSGVRLATLVNIRWMAVAGQTATLLIVYFGLEFDFPVLWAAAVVSVSGLLNLFLQYRFSQAKQLSESGAAWQLAYDLLQLSVLLALTGGIVNPFSVLILAPVTISATVLGRRSTAALLALAGAAALILIFVHAPLPWDDVPLEIAGRYIWGLWSGLAISMLFIVLYAGRVAEDSRRRAAALAATRAALEKEHHMAAIGGLAAAAAHELGTPLGTIMLTAKELKKVADLPSDVSSDLALIAEQARRCREILKGLSAPREGAAAGHGPLARTTLEAMVVEASDPHRDRGIEIDIWSGPDAADTGGQPRFPVRAEIRHGLGNFIENAVDFASSRVTIAVGWTADEIGVEITDDGPGFDPTTLPRLGEPYLPGRKRRLRVGAADREAASGLGLGVFIAKTLIEQTGGHVTFSNAPGGGARVSVRWRRDRLDANGDVAYPSEGV